MTTVARMRNRRSPQLGGRQRSVSEMLTEIMYLEHDLLPIHALAAYFLALAIKTLEEPSAAESRRASPQRRMG
ncbi:hypothetical protein SAMN05444161_0290 [Rhizobiales bacterium GAS191]|jgi:hypothetical protein|nr:hypothetical protein SAMN05519103_07783 [Rhizobiales bacterium GAS113]SEB99319.1 hypothetical protein SAMN05444161_0290 [Rhizobiales bacterium GAS191]SED19252.1 hypothetical protein SAMN05519104_3000 [Rhizobiales bacterium GAS188]